MSEVAHIDARTPKPPPQFARPIRDIIADLSNPLAPRHIKTREQGGRELEYIPWYFAVNYLDHFAPGWSYEIRQVIVADGQFREKIKDPADSKKFTWVDRTRTTLTMTVRISIPSAEGLISRDASAFEIMGDGGYGDAATNAESAALRRAASKFGLGLYLYDK